MITDLPVLRVMKASVFKRTAEWPSYEWNRWMYGELGGVRGLGIHQIRRRDLILGNRVPVTAEIHWEHQRCLLYQ